MMNSLKEEKNSYPTLPKYHDCKRVPEIFGEMYLGGKPIPTDGLFTIKNIKIDCNMDAAGFEGLL